MLFFRRTGKEGTSLGTRRLFFNRAVPTELLDEQGLPVQNFARNKIRTAKYTPLTFIPKNLWLQFHNVANVYFLFVTILAIFPIFGATNPALGSVPLIVILLITAIKDAIEDFRRTVLDNELNNTSTYILDSSLNPNVVDENISLWRKTKKMTTRILKTIMKKRDGLDASLSVSNDENGNGPEGSDWHGRSEQEFSMSGHELKAYSQTNPGSAELQRRVSKVVGPSFKRAYWKNIRVGDMVRVHLDEEIPADLIVLSTSSPDATCFLETKNLDGETNLKCRTALDPTKHIRSGVACGALHLEVESELPHANLFSFNGVLRSFRGPDTSDKEPQKSAAVTIDNLLLRGCTLKNTSWVIGFVVFTGDDTKIMMNSGITPSKRSRITQQLNWNVIINFVLLLVMCLVSGIAQGITWARGNESLDFFEFGSIGGSPAVDGIITFWTAVILFQNLVPISLYISIEIIKLAQAFFIFSDIKMYYERLDYPCTPKSWNLSDDLGQIEYVFSDKTGTLTQNLMEFRKCSVNGQKYGVLPPSAAGSPLSRTAYLEEKRDMLKTLDLFYKNPYMAHDQVTFVSSNFASDLHGSTGNAQQSAVKSFLLALSICHTALPDTSLGDSPHLVFQAQSPDEVALVATARDLGFAVVKRDPSTISVNSLGVTQEYELLRVLEFSSARKRMSCVVRFPQTGKIFVICKGADNVIFSRLAPDGQHELQKSTAAHLEEFGREGLRTLCIAEKEISEEEFRRWDAEYQIAAQSLQCREEKLEQVCDQLEVNFHLLGGTAIEDRLQEDVPETIKLLASAGIKVWVLTGDKVETAVNIGFSCNLLDKSMDIIQMKFKESEKREFRQSLESWLEKSKRSTNHGVSALVIDGECLKLALDADAREQFLALCQSCKAVLCCRVSPSQKAAVVQLIKKGLNVMTLAIGDGANDVAMIQEAEIGVGIAGEEGRQAVMSSDYAIGQFKYLSRLLLVHGRWSYRRLAEMVANFFYKNIVWTLALFWYQLYNNFDGTYLFEYSYILLYNLAFTSLPIILMGIFDQDVDDSVSLAVPQLYTKGILGKEWTQLKFWMYMIDGCYQSLICFFTTYFLFQSGTSVSSTGWTLNGREQMGVFVATSTVFVVNAYVLLNLYRWDWISLVVISLSILMVWFWTGIYSQFLSVGAFYSTVDRVFGAVVFWAITLLTVIVSLLPRFTIKVFRKLFLPKDIDIIREQASSGHFGRSEKASFKGAVFPQIEDDEEPICKVESERERRDTSISNASAGTK
ncbi:phospholipid-translocating P-type ATPase [Ascobolus immersus RN42]|uniref:Phospholipid-transporting ATPase n=1 Tax=Ascobolus immersus RN42 TaxID=1160509 RepID=A0A3N4I6U6_ASCIM|nr:phospholipid-translocating P-type ATPase [Ascobolus immersus RN42]